jgi:hypothetical protein
MAGPAGAADHAMEQALLAQLPPHTYVDAWRCRNAPAADASALPSPAPRDSRAIAPTAAQVESNDARPGAARPRPGASGAAAADGSVQIAKARQAARPKPVPPPRSGDQREAARLKALRMTADRKRLRARLQVGELTLEQALAQDEEAARGMRVMTLLRAIPGVGGATARRLMREAGIDAQRRAAALTTGQTARLLAAVDAELAARRDRRHDSGH